MTPTAFYARRGLAAAALSVGLLAGCGPDGKPVTSTADAAGQAALNKAVADPCNEPPGLNYPSAIEPPSTPLPKLSAKALQTLKNGCAGVKFQLTSDGSVVNASVVAESPRNYGFGDTALAGLKSTRFGPGQPKSDWYYYNAVFMQTAADGPAARPDVY